MRCLVNRSLAWILLACSLLLAPPLLAQSSPDQLYKQGLYREAYEQYERRLLDGSSPTPADDVIKAATSLRQLDRLAAFDGFVESVLERYSDNWTVMQAVAIAYRDTPGYGSIVDQEYRRGEYGGQYVQSDERDRVVAINLLLKAQTLAKTQGARVQQLRDLNRDLVTVLLIEGQEWRLQTLTDLTQLPDYQERSYRRNPEGAPVNESGDIVTYPVPESFSTAGNDGERLRFLLTEIAAFDGDDSWAHWVWADFLWRQFGVHTLDSQQYLSAYGIEYLAEFNQQLALKTLADNETTAKLATGIKRFQLPDDYNYIALLQKLASGNRYSASALERLGMIFEGRRQFGRAAEMWRTLIATNPANKKELQNRLDQIVGAWGRFESQPSEAAEVSTSSSIAKLRFRNATRAEFTLYPLHADQFIRDMKARLSSTDPDNWYQYSNLEYIGASALKDSRSDYLGKAVRTWSETLNPEPDHEDGLHRVSLPSDLVGAYLLKATMAGGNTSYIVLWHDRYILVKKDVANKRFYYAADAANGKPLANNTLHFFGYKRVWTEERSRINFETRERQFKTNTQGQLLLDRDELDSDYNWLITTDYEGEENRGFAWLGFLSHWYRESYDTPTPGQELKTFVVTNQPVYRPGQLVKFSSWSRYVSYLNNDAVGEQSVRIQIRDPKNDLVLDKTYTSDRFGAVSDEFSLAQEAGLGVYQIEIFNNNRNAGGGYFRVEEYKKPEFEVVVDGPTDVVRLGDTVSATVRADYYYGEPVTDAKVQYKILRYPFVDTWYPPGRWDWLYGNGYGWQGIDRPNLPGWFRWGHRAPGLYEGRYYSPGEPEIVKEGALALDSNGRAAIVIDTQSAALLAEDQDYRYEIQVEVTDASRRTIVANKDILVAREPYKLYAWLDKGFYQSGDSIKAQFKAQTLDRQGVAAEGEAVLYRLDYSEQQQLWVETVARRWPISTDSEGTAELNFAVQGAGQYRLALEVKAENVAPAGAVVFQVLGAAINASVSAPLELVPEKVEYAIGEKVELLINSAKEDAQVILFVRPGSNAQPELLALNNYQQRKDFSIRAEDQPNIFVEALTIFDGGVHTALKEIVVPPANKILNLEVVGEAERYQPADNVELKVKLTDDSGRPVQGTTTLAIYDAALDYIAGQQSADIKTAFWYWRRFVAPRWEHSADRVSNNLVKSRDDTMWDRGMRRLIETRYDAERPAQPRARGLTVESVPLGFSDSIAEKAEVNLDSVANTTPAAANIPLRDNFADTAFWQAQLETDANGEAIVQFDLPDNLTRWSARIWGLDEQARVGEGRTQFVTQKDLLLRLQAPRFFVEKDEVVLSANVHNYLESDEEVKVSLAVNEDVLKALEATTRTIQLAAGAQQRVDWRVKVTGEGEAVVRMAAVSARASDGVEMKFPAYIHGAPVRESFSGAMDEEEGRNSIRFSLPEQRRDEESRFELRYSPTLAGALVDALPYLVEYAYGCTEQTLSRFLPTVLVHDILQRTGVDLERIAKQQSGLNPQQEVNPLRTLQQPNPVFDAQKVAEIAATGLQRLLNMQIADGGWGWFSGSGARSAPHTTAHVVRGLLVARDSGLAVDQGSVQRGVQWLQNYLAKQRQQLSNADNKTEPYKLRADNLDALIVMVLVDAGLATDSDVQAMSEFLVRDHLHLSVYGRSLLALSLHNMGRSNERDGIRRNIEQYLQRDASNQTAYLDLPNQNYWWLWYGSEFEAQAMYLKLLAAVEPQGDVAPALVKYLLNNRRHSGYWQSTRDTALIIEAMADYLLASGELKPELELEIKLDGQRLKTVKLNEENLFSLDNRLLLGPDQLSGGEHQLELLKQGKGPLYYNAYLDYFSLQDFIGKAGLEVTVERRYYRLHREEKTLAAADARGNVREQSVDNYRRERINENTELLSGDLLEVELLLNSKNDYEYILLEDMKAAGLEPVAVRSGYQSDSLGSYVEYRDNRAAFFIERLPRGSHSLSYRLRAEIPGRFSALPARVEAMYAPDIAGNSDEDKIQVRD